MGLLPPVRACDATQTTRGMVESTPSLRCSLAGESLLASAPAAIRIQLVLPSQTLPPSQGKLELAGVLPRVWDGRVFIHLFRRLCMAQRKQSAGVPVHCAGVLSPNQTERDVPVLLHGVRGPGSCLWLGPAPAEGRPCHGHSSRPPHAAARLAWPGPGSNSIPGMARHLMPILPPPPGDTRRLMTSRPAMK